MKSARLFSVITALAVAFIFFCTANQASASNKNQKPPPPVDDRKLIKSVDTAGSEITIEYKRDGTEKTYKVDFMTVLKVNNSAGKISDVKAGMVVDDYLERDNDVLDSITVSGYPSDKPATGDKPKSKPKPSTSSTPPADSNQ